MSRASPARAACLLAAGLLAAGLFGGCGLEIIPVLERPGNPILATPTTPRFQLVYTTANNQAEFRGFELYYKFYLSGSTLETNYQTVDELRSHGFRRVLGTGDTLTNFVPPLVPVDPADRAVGFTSEADLSTLPSPTGPIPSLLYAGTVTGPRTIQVLRSAQDATTGQLKSFAPVLASGASNYLSTDQDLSSDIVAAGRVDAVLYGLAFGLLDFSTPLYSAPVYLGYATITLPP